MTQNMPRTPFSTPLSRSTREAELRIRNIMSGPKKRPPLPFLALMFAVCIFCGNLVSCQMAEADAPDRSASVSASPDASLPEELAEEWLPVELDNKIVCGSFSGNWSDVFQNPKNAILKDLPVNELPREAGGLYYARRPMRQDYWRDMLLPVAAAEEADVTLYFAFDPDSMPNVEPLVSPAVSELTGIGVVLRYGDKAQYLDVTWQNHQKYGYNPWLAVDDFDGDGQPEAAFSLGWGSGTGCNCECLYIIDLDDIPYSDDYYPYPPGNVDCSNIPLEITVSPDGTAAKLASGGLSMPVDLKRLYAPFPGRVEVGNQVQFRCKDGQLLCNLHLDFGCNTLGYLSSAEFPVVYEDGEYRLGPAVALRDIL